MQPICCPRCHSQLLPLGEAKGFFCTICNLEFPEKNGVIDFIPEDRFYWGEISQTDMQAINLEAARSGWFEALIQGLERRKSLQAYLLDPTRLAWLFHAFEADRRGTCLDLGSGWGPIAFGLSRFYETVYSVDGVFERMQYQSIRARQEGVENIHFLRSKLLELPFEDGSMDLIVVNGLLEWIGLTNDEDPPAKLQESFLSEIQRVLRDGGKVYIGIENRYGIQYFLGGKDHTGLPFTSLLPRKLANAVVRSRQSPSSSFFHSQSKQFYRTYTYSFWGYRRLLHQAGFVNQECYWAWPSYNYPRVSGPMTGGSVKIYLDLVTSVLRSSPLRTILDLFRWIPGFALGFAMKFASPSFLIIAQKKFHSRSLQDDFLQADKDRDWVRLTRAFRPDLSTTYLVGGSGRGRSALARVIKCRAQAGEFITDEIKPETGRPLNPNRLDQLEIAARWLTAYQRQTDSGPWDIQDLEQEIDRIHERLITVISSPEALTKLAGYLQAYKGLIRSSPLSKVQVHGDFTPTNILIHHGRVTLIDWESSVPEGHPFLDIGALTISVMDRSRQNGNRKRAGQPSSGGLLLAYARMVKAVTGDGIAYQPAYYLMHKLARCIEIHGDEPVVRVYVEHWLPKLIQTLDLQMEYSGLSFS